MTDIATLEGEPVNAPATNDPSTTLPGMFKDERFRGLGRYKYLGDIDGVRVGVVLITKNDRFETFACNKGDLERLLDALRAGRVDRAFAVWARVGDGLGHPTYVKHDEAEPVHGMMVEKLRPRARPFGEFWVVPENLASYGVRRDADNDDIPF
jgi:hypothetical protein